MGSNLCKLAIISLAFTGLSAGDLPAETQAKFIKILASSAGSARPVTLPMRWFTSSVNERGSPSLAPLPPSSMDLASSSA